MEAGIRVIVATLTGFVAFAAVSAQAVPNTKHENWHPLDTRLLFGLGDEACGDDWHQAPPARLGWANGGGVRACPIDDPVPLGGCLFGLGA